MATMMKTLLLISAIMAYFHIAGALQCYSCGAFRKTDMKECLNIDGTVKVETCGDGYPICFESGINLVFKTATRYSNQRACGKKGICDSINKDYKGNVRKCRVCSTDKCNNSTLA
ncbi:hypothetical protein HHI36_012222 [Cryptolaemus montrouzieri]|uniref:Uncharacterized protein n=1 Tax=Cryptolaemus montrouzieri TaxID=559131 RepID=A0ABD2NEL9_9CUCU